MTKAILTRLEKHYDRWILCGAILPKEPLDERLSRDFAEELQAIYADLDYTEEDEIN